MRYLIFGAGLFGKSLARRLTELGAQVYVVDHNEAAVDEVKDAVAGAIVGESTEREIVTQIVEKVKPDVCAVCFGENFDATLLATIYLKELGIRHIIARASNHLQKQILHKLGVEQVVLPEVMMGERTGEHIILGESEFLPLDAETAVARVRVPEKLESQPPDAIPLKKYSLTLLFVHRMYLRDKVFKIIFPPQLDEIAGGDNLVVLGNPGKIAEFVKELHAEARKKEE